MNTPEAPRVILDTNCITKNPLLKGNDLERLLRMKSAGHLRICIPEAVLQEVSRQEVKRQANSLRALKKWAEDAPLDHLSALSIAQGNVRSSMAVEELIPNVPDRAQMADKIRVQWRDMGVSILEPSGNVTTLLEDYLEGRRPFKINGVGVADWIIWQTVVASLDETPTYFVSANTSDFAADKKGEPITLHNDLENKTGGRPVTLITKLSDLFSLFPEIDSIDHEEDWYAEEYESYEEMAKSAARGAIEGMIGESYFKGDREGAGLIRDAELTGWRLDVQGVEIDEESLDWSIFEETPYGEKLGTVTGEAEFEVQFWVELKSVSVVSQKYSGFIATDVDQDGSTVALEGRIQGSFSCDVFARRDDADVNAFEITDAYDL